MRYLSRMLEVKKRLRSKSHFLFGPRQTGKSTLVRWEFPEALTYNLLESDVFLSLSRNPGLLREEFGKGTGLVVVDEIQKLPDLLDEIHLLIEERGGRFLLTGSSARKLWRGVNLLGGRERSLTLRSYIDYSGRGSLAYWRSTSGFEVDFILDDSTAMAVKARETVGHRDCKGLLALREEGALKRYLLVCLARRPRVADGIEIIPWPLFLDRLWDGDLGQQA